MTTHENGFTYPDECSRPQKPQYRPFREAQHIGDPATTDAAAPDPRNKITPDLEAASHANAEIIATLQLETKILRDTIGRLHSTIEKLKDKLHRSEVHSRMIQRTSDSYHQDSLRLQKTLANG